MSVPVTVRYWAGARRAAGRDSESMQASDLLDLRAQLGRRSPELARVVQASTILVDARSFDPAHPLPVSAVIDVLPPFAGG